MTNAQIHADNAVKAKIQQPAQREAFKLKRFQNINPKTSTKRGNTAYMVEARSNANKTILWRIWAKLRARDQGGELFRPYCSF